MNDRPEFSYIAEKPCGCVVGAIVDDILNCPEDAKEVAACITRWRKAGMTVKRVPHQYVRDHFVTECPHVERQGVLP